MSKVVDAALWTLKMDVQRLAQCAGDRVFLMQHIDNLAEWLKELETQHEKRLQNDGA